MPDKLELRHIPRVNKRQVVFGKKLSLDLIGCTVGVAAARIRRTIDDEFWGQIDSRSPTQKQIAFADKYGYDITNLNRDEADAVVDDLMTELNLQTIHRERLSPSVVVVNIHDRLGRQWIISSITEDGTVYFRGGQGKRAWARGLRRLADIRSI